MHLKVIYYNDKKYIPISLQDIYDNENLSCYKASPGNSINPDVIKTFGISLPSYSKCINWKRVTLNHKDWDSNFKEGRVIDSLIQKNCSNGLYMLPYNEYWALKEYNKKRLDYAVELHNKILRNQKLNCTLRSILQTKPLKKDTALSTLKKYFNWHSNKVLKITLNLFIEHYKLNPPKIDLDHFYKNKKEYKKNYPSGSFLKFPYNYAVQNSSYPCPWILKLDEKKLELLSLLTNRSLNQTKQLYSLCNFNSREILILEDTLQSNNLHFCPKVYKDTDIETYKHSIEYIRKNYKPNGLIMKSFRLSLENKSMKSIKNNIKIINEKLIDKGLDPTLNWDILLEYNKENAVKELRKEKKEYDYKTAKSYIDIIWDVFYNGRKPYKKHINKEQLKYITIALTDKKGNIEHKRFISNSFIVKRNTEKKIKPKRFPIKKKVLIKDKRRKIKYNHVPDKMICIKKLADYAIIEDVKRIWRINLPGYIETGWTPTSKSVYKNFKKNNFTSPEKNTFTSVSFKKETDKSSLYFGKLITVFDDSKKDTKRLKQMLRTAKKIKKSGKLPKLPHQDTPLRRE